MPMDVIARHYSQPLLHHDRDPKISNNSDKVSKVSGCLRKPKIQDLPLKQSSADKPLTNK